MSSKHRNPSSKASSFGSKALFLAAMAPTSRSKVSTKGRPQSKLRKKTAAQPPRLLTPRPPLSRTTSLLNE
ncbi:hypothetical protein C369_04827 [Cryptococcus neoformans A5-35-17]|nr:hypothetical protein C369_04827 [Cryptococcus neoformans var. grubii A5-35-17]